MGVSDLTGQMAEEDQLGTLTVLEHPELAEGPVLGEALAEEVKTLPRLSVPAVIVEWRAPGEESSRRYILPAEAFNARAAGRKMGDVLAEAQPVKTARRASGGGASNNDYSLPENAGMPHRGKITEAEQEYV